MDPPRPLLGENPQRKYIFLVQETEPPFEYSLIDLDGEILDLGRKKMETARNMWETCLGSDEWPGYDRKIQTAMLPTWVAWDWESREAVL